MLPFGLLPAVLFEHRDLAPELVLIPFFKLDRVKLFERDSDG